MTLERRRQAVRPPWWKVD